VVDCYYGPPCSYYDLTTTEGVFTFPPIGQFRLSVYENADTASSGTGHNTYMNFSANNGNGPGTWGTCSVNFKQLIEKGGGAFNGTFKPEGGSAQVCGSTIYGSLDPLTIAGNVNVTTNTITISIKGKIYL
jgi:hypothetical protein